MTIDRNLGKQCKYAETCTLFDGVDLPEKMTQSLWRNVFCYRGTKGWENCTQYQVFQKEQ